MPNLYNISVQTDIPTCLTSKNTSATFRLKKYGFIKLLHEIFPVNLIASLIQSYLSQQHSWLLNLTSQQWSAFKHENRLKFTWFLKFQILRFSCLLTLKVLHSCCHHSPKGFHILPLLAPANMFHMSCTNTSIRGLIRAYFTDTLLIRM